MIASAFPVALTVNIVRVLVLGLLSLIDPDLGTGEVHTMVGVFLLLPAWLLFLGVAEILKRLMVEQPKSDIGTEGRIMNFALTLHASQRRAILIVVGLVGLSRVGMSFAMDALNIYLKRSPYQSDVLWQTFRRS